jgi:hypothetical protein
VPSVAGRRRVAARTQPPSRRSRATRQPSPALRTPASTDFQQPRPPSPSGAFTPPLKPTIGRGEHRSTGGRLKTWTGRTHTGQAQEGSFDESTIVPQTTPTTGTDFSGISAKGFLGRIDTTGTQWAYSSGPNCCTDLSRVGSELFADAQFQVPTGATLNFFRFWAFDTNAANLALFVFRVCQPAFAGGAPTVTTIASTATSGTPGHTTGLVALNELVDNQSCVYLARVRFDAASTTLALQKVRLQFTR